jgi:hypothetical protein
MKNKQGGVPAPFRITRIVVMQLSGTDEVRIETDLPLGVYPYKDYPQALKFEVTRGMGIKYVKDNFGIEPEVLRT